MPIAPNNDFESTRRIYDLIRKRHPNLRSLDDDEESDNDFFDGIWMNWHPGITYAQWYKDAVRRLITGNTDPDPIPKGPITNIDSLYPITDKIKQLKSEKIKSPIIPIKEVECGIEGPVVIAAVATRIAPRDANDLAKVAKRGYKLRGPTMYLNMFMRDDSDEILCQIDRRDYQRLALGIIETGKAGKALYAIRGTVPPGFRMINIQRIIYLGDMDQRIK